MHKKATQIQSGFLIHLFRGEDSEAEFATLRKICMRYGIQSWDIMHSYLPWKSRAEIRNTLCKILGKQALSEFKDIRADPFAMSEEIEKDYLNAPQGIYKKKGGIIVNQKFGISEQEKAEILENNKKKFDLKNNESIEIGVLPIIKIEFLQERVKKRRVAQMIFRAALLAEKARRKGEKSCNLKLKKVTVVSGRKVFQRRPETKIKYSKDTSDVLFDCEQIIEY